MATRRRTEASFGRQAPPLAGCGSEHAKRATDDVGAASNLAVQPLQGVRGLELPAVLLGEVHVGQDVVLRVPDDRGGVGVARLQQRDGARDGFLRARPIGLLEDGADSRGREALGLARQAAQHVAQEVNRAALPGDPVQDGADGRPQARVGVGDDQHRSGQTAGHQVLEEGPPARLHLARGDFDAQDLPFPGVVDAVGHQDGFADHPAALAHLQVQRVQPQVRPRPVPERPRTERLDLLVEEGVELCPAVLSGLVGVR